MSITNYIQRIKNERMEAERKRIKLNRQEAQLKSQVLRQEAIKQERLRKINEERNKTFKQLEEDKLRNMQLEKEFKEYEQSQTTYGKVKGKISGIVKQISASRNKRSSSTPKLNTKKAQSGLNRLGSINRGSTGIQLGNGGVQQSPFNMAGKGSPFNMKRKGGSLF